MGQSDVMIGALGVTIYLGIGCYLACSHRNFLGVSVEKESDFVASYLLAMSSLFWPLLLFINRK